MKMRIRAAAAAVAVAALVGGAAAGVTLSAPTAAFAQEAEDESAPLGDAVSTVEEVLAQLVADNVITQSQADAVAEALEEARPFHHRHGKRGGDHLEVAAQAIGIEVDELGAALREGQSLADIAAANNVTAQAVIDALVADATERIDEAVVDGRLTQQEADEKLAEVTERITAMVNGEFEGRGPGHGDRGPRGAGPGADDDAAGTADALLDA